jgi:Mg-chelatase subunit ChlD
MILDVSGSMNEYGKIDLMKQAAKRIVSTLTVADGIAIVPFASEPRDVIARDNAHTCILPPTKISSSISNKLMA